MFCQPLSQLLGRRARLSRAAVFLSYLAVIIGVAARTATAMSLSRADAQRIMEDISRARRTAESFTVAQAAAITAAAATTTTTITTTRVVSIQELQKSLSDLNKEIYRLEEQKHLIDLATAGTSEGDGDIRLQATLDLIKAMMSKECHRRLLDNNSKKMEELLIKRVSVTSKIAALSRHNDNTKQNNTDNDEQQSTWLNQSNSRLICQLFVFGTIFGVVCTISACTWSFSKSDENANNLSIAGGNNSSITRLTQTPEPFDSTKPYCIKVDEKGMCYASPLSNGEVPPLPGYNEALKMSRNITTLFNKAVVERESVLPLDNTLSDESSSTTTMTRNNLMKA